MKSIGENGYLQLAKEVMQAAKQMKAAVRQTDGLDLVVDVDSCGFAFKSLDPANCNIFAVADEMESLGWKMERQNNPDSLHCTIFPAHANMKTSEIFGNDLKASVATVRSKAPKKKDDQSSVGVYGAIGNLANVDASLIDDFLKTMFSEIYKT